MENFALRNNIAAVNMGIQNLTGFQFVALLMAGVWIFSIRLLILAYRSIGWPTVEGRITKSDVVRSAGEIKCW